mmetsp:Transcript_843/g.2383  ORF Transcript_843/g.2383 Transcript_843/m.2383 type:complete len:202 (+) Transcript_843:14-619(+)
MATLAGDGTTREAGDPKANPAGPGTADVYDSGRGLQNAKEDLKAGKTLLQRFEEDKKKVRPEVAEAGIMVLDSLILRLKNFRSGLKKTIDDRKQEIADLEKEIISVQPNYDKVKKLYDAHIAERDSLQKEVDQMTEVLDANVKAASALLQSATRSHGKIKTNLASSMLEANRGFTSDGKPLPGRETNNLRRPVQAANTRVP